LVGSVIRTVVAATVPDESALPWAVTHFPTLTEVDVVDASVVIFVLAPTVTDLFVVAVLLELFGPKSRAAITSVEPDTEVTLPPATAPKFGRPEAPPDGNPDGRCPDGRPEGRCPLPPPRPPKAPAPHAPSTAALTVIVVAVNDVAAASVPDGAMAVTQSPAFTAASVVVTWWLNFVDALHATATWPVCWFCTCIVVPVIAATVPEAAGPP